VSKEVVGNWAEEGGGEDAILLFSESLHQVGATLGSPGRNSAPPSSWSDGGDR